MTAPGMSTETKTAIEQGIRLAWAAEADRQYGVAEDLLHCLHAKYGTPAVRAVALSLLAMRPGGEPR